MVVAAGAVISGKVAIDDVSFFDFSGAAPAVNGTYRVYLGILLCAGYVYVVSAYMLGGMVWKGRSWLLTTITLALLSLLLNVIIDLNEPFSTVYSKEQVELGEKAFCVCCSLAFMALAALNVWATWRLFSRMQPSVGKLTLQFRIRSPKTSAL